MLSPQHDKIHLWIGTQWPNKVRNSGLGSRDDGQKYKPSNSRAKGRWGSQRLTPNSNRSANGSPSGHWLTPNGGREECAINISDSKDVHACPGQSNISDIRI